MKEFFNSLFQTSNERMKNPFVSSFIIAAIVLNWKAVLVLFLSNKYIEEKIVFVSREYLNFWSLLIYPVLIAGFYVIILPYIMLGISKLVKYAKENQIIDHYDEEIIRVEKKSEVAELEVKLERIRAKSEDLSDLNEQIKMLQKTNKEKDSIIKDLQGDFERFKINSDKKINQSLKIERVPEGIKDYEFQDIIENVEKRSVLQKIGSADDEGDFEIPIPYYNKIKNELDFFKRINILKIEVLNNGVTKVSLTNKGRIYWDRLKLRNNLLA